VTTRYSLDGIRAALEAPIANRCEGCHPTRR
jgi:hypothetical protein